MNAKSTKAENSKLISTEQEAELEAVAAMSEDQIDTSDIPEVKNWSSAKRGKFYHPIKHQLTLRIDADILAWFKEHAQNGKGYQTNINQALREYVERHVK